MTANLTEKWAKCLEMIRSNVGEDRYNTWFVRAEVVSYENDMLVLKLPSQFFVDMYEERFYDVLRYALKASFGHVPKLEYVFDIINNDDNSRVRLQSPERSHAVTSKVIRQIEKSSPEERQRDYDPQLNSALNFENYCVGQSNRLPYTIAEHIANHPESQDFNPFFLYGKVGVGKTHLIQAIGIRIKEHHPRARVLFVTMRQFQNQYFNAMKNKEIPDFINWYQGMDAILFDDLQELTGKVGTAEALFPVFNHLHQHNKKLVFTCDRPPQELDGIADRLIDRFKWGITEPLQAPDFELRKKILHFKASRNGLDLSDEIIELIAGNADGSVRELEGIVMGLYMRSIKNNEPITLALARDVISHSVKVPAKPTIHFDMIVEATAEYYGLNSDTIFTKCRVRDIADARQMVMYLCNKHTSLSTPAIGAKLNREHSTVIYGIKAVEDRLATSRDTVSALEAIEASLLK